MQIGRAIASLRISGVSKTDKIVRKQGEDAKITIERNIAHVIYGGPIFD